MPLVRKWLWLMVSLLTAGATSLSLAAGIHDRGVGACSHCHVMHMDEIDMSGNNPLLIESNASDLCLGCHAQSLGSVLGTDPTMPPPERGPGNFVFLLEENLNDAPDGLANPIPGDAAGHNLNAPGYGLASDPTHVTSPGGTYPSGEMRCTSCHDPHGNQNYRFLYGAGAQGGNGFFFPYPAPVADGLDLVTGGPESNSNHVAYKSGMSLWCGNCHQDYVTSRHLGMTPFSHPTDRNIPQGYVNHYNAYNGTLDPSGGIAATAYLAAVPFEDPNGSVTSTAGPSTASRIICLSCHRAHGSSGPQSGRWDFHVDALGLDGVVSGSYPLPNPYGDPGQEPLCLKCHRNIPGPGVGQLNFQN